jgi:predicted ATPase/class 3 adenylate cyclase/DNA-binding CsgD family transcriptional regulator
MRLPLVVDTGGVGGGFSLPAGTVTFLLTDIESSTRNWEADRAVMAAAVARHYEVLDRAVADHGGVRPVEQGEGDSVVAAFAKASDAVAAALAAQRALLAELGSVFRVRMAVHTGEAMLRPDRDGVVRNYVGPAIIRAARLRACGHGGQVLVSGAAAELAADVLPEGVSLVDLGSRRLRDLVRAERVFQLVHPELPGEFPPLRSLEELPNTLPTPLTSLVGRHEELTALPAVLAAHRLVTLTGAGGVGKTRLAQQLAADLIDRHPGGTWWVELAPAATPEAVTTAVADGVRLSLRPAPDPADQLAAHLTGPERTLVVFDNCEHVLDTITPLTHHLLSACPSVSILATSRERLGVPGEQVRRVASLTCPDHGEAVPLERLDTFDAVTLFVDRARQTRPNFTVDAHTAPHIAAICTRLDGIPLAIELAAARTRSLPVERVAAGLDDAFRLLTGGPQVVVPRQQTLLASITWSYQLLGDGDRAVLRRLAVCPTWFDIDAAEAVAADDSIATLDVLDSLTRLVDKNLLEYDDTAGRYRMLETIRQYTLSLLTDTNEHHPTQQRYADHWAARTLEVAVAGRYDQPAVRSILTDVITMLDWAMAHDDELASRVLAATAPMVYGLGSWADLHHACDWVLADRPRGLNWAAAVAQVSMLASFIGRLDVFTLTDEAVALAAARGDTATINLLSVGPAMAAAHRGELKPGRELLTAATSSGDTYSAFLATTYLANSLAQFGQLEELTGTCQLGALSMHATTRSREPANIMTTGLGPPLVIADHLAGDLTAAIERLPRQPLGWELHAAHYAAAAGRLAIARQDPTLAARAEPWVDRNDSPGTATHRNTVAWAVAMLRGYLDDAVVSATAAVNTANVVPDHALALSDLAATLAALGRWEQLAPVLEQLDTVIADLHEPAPRIRASAAVTRTIAALAAGRIAGAEHAAHEALRTAADAGLRLIHVDALEAVAAVALTADDHTRATRLVAAADAERRRRGYRGRFTSAVPASLVAQPAADHAQAWDEGRALTLEEATAFAQRTRGPRGRPSFGVDALTPTERLVVDHVRAGRTNAEIAAELLVSVPTVKTHLTRIFAKLGVRNRAELASLAANATQH